MDDKSNSAFWHNFFSGIFLVLIVAVTVYLNSNGKLEKAVPFFDFFLLLLAVFRLIRLFVYDSVTEHIRGYFGRFETGARRELFRLINCPWCIGIWAGLLVSSLYFITPLSRFFIFVLAIAGAGSFIQIVIWRIGVEPPWYKEK